MDHALTEAVSLRPLRPEDVDGVVGMGARAFDDATIGASIRATLDLYFESGLAELTIGDQPADAMPREYFALLLATGGEPALVGMTGIYAFGTWTWRGNLWLGWTAIDPGYQSRGIGSAMLPHLIAIARDRGAVRLKVETGRGGRAVSFYVRNGFHHEAVLRDHYGPGHDADILARDLRPRSPHRTPDRVVPEV